MASCSLGILLLASSVLSAGMARGRPESSRPDTPLDADPERDGEQNEFLEALIEDLKSRILRGLNLPEPPSGSSGKLSSDVVQLLQEDQEVSRREPKENLIVHPSNSDFGCWKGNGTACRTFEFNVTSEIESVTSVQAWFHKGPSRERITVHVYSSPASQEDPLVTLKEDLTRMSTESGWVTFELPKKLALEPEGERLFCTIETEGADVDLDEDHSPFLVVTKHTEILDRKRRVVEATTSENCICCTDTYYVTLKDLNWQDWVFYPTGFNVSVCRGRCDDSLSAYTLNYQRIINTLYKNNRILPKPKCNFWAPHCKPDKYLPLRMIYYSENRIHHDHVLEDMLIDSCRCM